MNKKEKIIFIISIIIFSGASFYVGMNYEKKEEGVSQLNRPNNLNTNISRQRQDGGMINGEVKEIKDNILTIGVGDEGSKLVLFSDSTQVQKTTSGDIEDIKLGIRVVVTGSENQDGSITARSIQITEAGGIRNFRQQQ